MTDVKHQAFVYGADTLIGHTLLRVLESAGWSVEAGTSHSHILAGEAGVNSRSQPSVVFCCPPWRDDHGRHAVDAGSAADFVDSAVAAARAARARLVLFSSDHVFDGSSGPYAEMDAPAAADAVGRLDSAAEARALEDQRALVVRASYLYGWSRQQMNPAMRVWTSVSAGEPLHCSASVQVSPTLVDYLAEVTLRLVEAEANGIVHVAGADRLSEADFSRRLARAFALDPTLIVDAPDKNGHGNRGLRTRRLSDLLGTEAMSLDEAFKRIRRQWRADTHHGLPAKSASAAAEVLKQEILEKVRQYHGLAHQRPDFAPLSSRVPYAGRVYGAEEMVNLVDASLDFWLTLGPWGDLFELRLRRLLGARDAVLVNSGSSANLTAVTSLMYPSIENGLSPGDEVITPAVTFPTTLAPLIQNGLVPVLVDCVIGTYNIDADLIEDAVSERTRAIMVPHTLGNPCDLTTIVDIAKRHELFLIEDSCDALGSRWDGQPVGTFGDLATISFYPAHHITMGEGGAVIVNRARYSRVVRSVRDWGRDCWCAPGETNTCGKRFGWQLGNLPKGYDHKYIYSHVGYNLKPTDMQAAIGVAQLERIDDFVSARRANFSALYDGLRAYEDRVLLPTWDQRAEPAWFGFPLTVQAGTSRRALVQFLEDSNIETREIFGGNVVNQPGYLNARVKVHGHLTESDRVMNDSFFVGVYPGLTDRMIDFVLERFRAFFRTN